MQKFHEGEFVQLEERSNVLAEKERLLLKEQPTPPPKRLGKSKAVATKMSVFRNIHNQTVDSFLQPIFNVRNHKERLADKVQVQKVCSNQGLLYDKDQQELLTRNFANRSILGRMSAHLLVSERRDASKEDRENNPI